MRALTTFRHLTGGRIPPLTRTAQGFELQFGVNHLGTYGRWAFTEFTEVYRIESEFKAKVESEFNKMIAMAAMWPASGSFRPWPIRM